MVKKTQENGSLGPDYIRIYTDLIKEYFPERLEEFSSLLSKDILDFFAVTQLNKKLFGKKSYEEKELEQRYRSYDKQTILRILRYQKKNNLSNTQLANHFGLSKNTVIKWSEIFGALSIKY